MKEEALWKDLADTKGMALVKIRSNQKEPLEKYRKLTHRSYDQIGFKKGMNAGIITGRISGIIVLDVDQHELFARYLAENAFSVPETFTVETCKGKHYYYLMPEDQKEYTNRSNKSAGFDIRADGGYIIAPGSVHPSGSIYTIVDDRDLSKAPQWLLDHSHKIEPTPNVKQLKRNTPRHNSTVDISSLDPELQKLITDEQITEDRSAIGWRVINSLLDLGMAPDVIVSIFLGNPIGSKAEEKLDPEAWLYEEIDRATSKRESLLVLETKREIIGNVDEYWEGITKLAHLRTLELLRRHENEPSEKHEEALFKVAESFTNMISGKLNGRIALPLPPGYGKTTSITAFLSVLNGCGYFKYGLKSIVVMSTKVEQLCEGYRYAKDLGIPEELMSIIHSYSYDPLRCNPNNLPTNHASEPAVLDPCRPIVFLTHAKVKRDGGQVKGANEFDIQSYLDGRDLAIWDESFISSDIEVVQSDDFADEVAVVHSRALKQYDVLDFEYEVVDYLKMCAQIITEECERLVDNNATRPVLPFPKLSQSERNAYLEACTRTMGESKSTRGSKIKTIRQFFRMLQDDMVIHYKTSQNAAVLRGAVVIPDEFSNAVILDASAEINYMMLLDRTIALPEDMPELELSYKETVISRIPQNAGRSSIEKECVTGERGLVDTIVELVLGRVGEPFLFFHCKHRDIKVVNCREVLETALQRSGIDLDATDSEGRMLYNWLNLGNETASNSYSHCTNVVFMGLMHLSNEVLRGKILSQMRDVTAKLDPKLVDAVQKAELVYALHQGSCRSQIRHIRNDHASAGNVWYTYPNDSLVPMLQKVFPEASFGVHSSEHLNPQSKGGRLEKVLIEYLSTLNADVQSISNQKLKKIAQESIEFGRTVFTETINVISNNPNIPWKKVRQSMVRA